MNTIETPAFSAKDPAEIVGLAFDFATLTAAPSAPVVSATHLSGTEDVSPGAVLSGSASVNGAKIVQRVAGGLAGANYLLRCQIDAPDGSRYVLTGVLPVRSA